MKFRRSVPNDRAASTVLRRVTIRKRLNIITTEMDVEAIRRMVIIFDIKAEVTIVGTRGTKAEMAIKAATNF